MTKNPIRMIASLLAVLGITALVFAGCSDSAQKDGSTQTNQAAQKDVQAAHYTCPMHSEVSQAKPGDCPKCGMKLVEKR
jgi:heavy metal-binding protein